jgi:hypothetical protein
VTFTPEDLTTVVSDAGSRLDLWVDVITRTESRRVAEIGVFRGAFAEELLGRCPAITDYYMIDPWRHLDDWNKPANKGDQVFDKIFQEAMDRTAAHAERRHVLRGRTTEVIDQIPDGHLDFAYVDGDHTLRGIAIDLIQVFGKVRRNGWLAGDDFARRIWQHGQDFEPTMVFPFAVYFAEAVGCPIHALPFGQFLIEKDPGLGFSFNDLTDSYPATDVLSQFRQAPQGLPQS